MILSVREIIELHILGKLNQQPNPTGQSLSQQGNELSIDGISLPLEPGREPALSATVAALQFGETTVHVLSNVLPEWHTFSQ